ncbi:hypothetical protein [Mucilaginibacter arboris]|uniref:Uncharacterized protein n=1 Tax=Mucilaginibacter arboris TaxID=2682090 RepID=A0A7K1SVB0_9SPHI|nr:hypothetical protein [Mucilaginibacter arboris]MVN21266.1 hypothetical protein [Mucilaginibacter arboris]
MKSDDNKGEDALKIALENERVQTWRDFEITTEHVAFLNQLNAFLSNTEEKIVKQAKQEILSMEQKLKDTTNLITDYEVFAEVVFFTKYSDGDPVFTARHPFGLHNVSNNDWGLLCDGEDWRESGWLPQLEKRCCYLMHELAYHSGIMQQIFDIDSIWIDIKVWDQSMFLYKNGEWQNQKSY